MDRYFSRLPIGVDPDKPGFKEALWIRWEDVSVEHLLDIFTSVDTNSAGVWDTCACFMERLSWHKIRLVVLVSKI